MSNWLAIFIGGGAGSLARYGLSLLTGRWSAGAAFPWGTLFSNVMATLIIGLLVWRWQTHAEGKEMWWALLAVGFCGGFSTFSAFSLETIQLMREGLILLAWLNVIVSVSACMLVLHFIAKAS